MVADDFVRRRARFDLAFVVVASLVGCANGSGVHSDDAGGHELALKDHGPWDSALLDAAECTGPNPTDANNSGTFCVTHFSYICLDIAWHHVCVDGLWQCPEPGMILSRDCRGWTNMPRGDGGDGASDADTGGCSTPNPTQEGDPGSYCVRHLGGVCFDAVFQHVCVDEAWVCPEPDMILVRDCEHFGNRPDVGLPDSGPEDQGDRDALPVDAGD